MLNIICIVNGYLEENCYILYYNKNALIIDPGSESNRIIAKIEELKLNVVGVLITHSHFDHIGALNDIVNKYKCIVVNNENRIEKLNEFNFKIIENYGHTMDSISFLFEKDKVMFTGDFVFKETIGNYDMKNENIMISSLKKFKLLNKDIIIYPGHGDKTSVDYELKNNPYLRGNYVS